MTSSLSWLDHDAAAADRSLRILALFQERESRDELGIGAIRDAIADQLFPGTSTIQTRLRYFFFVPWIFSQLDEKRTLASALPAATREAENKLLAALVGNEQSNVIGIIGREAGATLKRLPSSVYWSGLGSWGLRKQELSLQQYLAQADGRRAARQARRPRDDGDASDADTAGRAWHLQALRLRPAAFPDDATLALTHEEAALLLDLWTKNHPETLLTWLANDLRGHGTAISVDRVWEHPRYAKFPQSIRGLLHHARRFDALVRGAALLYNLQLAQADDREDTAKAHGEALQQWQEESAALCADWDLRSFWPQVVAHGHFITGETRLFIERWRNLVASAGDGNLSESTHARELIEQRERRLKGPRSRFANRAALRQWGGSAGLSPLGFRWPTTRILLSDWYEGWKRA